MRDEPRCPVAQLTTCQLDRYDGQLLRCLKALGTDAPSAPTSSASWLQSGPSWPDGPPRQPSSQSPRRPGPAQSLPAGSASRNTPAQVVTICLHPLTIAVTRPAHARISHESCRDGHIGRFQAATHHVPLMHHGTHRHHRTHGATALAKRPSDVSAPSAWASWAA
jgi:hypothetical protein